MENIFEDMKIMSVDILIVLSAKGEKLPLPIIFGKEDDVFIAWCPILDISTQGKTIEEAKENMGEMVADYLKDPDTPKPKFVADVEQVSSMEVKQIPDWDHGKVSSLHGKTKTIKA